MTTNPTPQPKPWEERFELAFMNTHGLNWRFLRDVDPDEIIAFISQVEAEAVAGERQSLEAELIRIRDHEPTFEITAQTPAAVAEIAQLQLIFSGARSQLINEILAFLHALQEKAGEDKTEK